MLREADLGQLLAPRREEINRVVDPVFEKFNREAAGYLSHGGNDVLPEQVFSHGFIEFTSAVCNLIPFLGWRGRMDEIKANPDADPNKFFRKFYNVFAQRLIEMPSFDGLTPERKIELVEEGWNAWLKD